MVLLFWFGPSKLLNYDPSDPESIVFNVMNRIDLRNRIERNRIDFGNRIDNLRNMVDQALDTSMYDEADGESPDANMSPEGADGESPDASSESADDLRRSSSSSSKEKMKKKKKEKRKKKTETQKEESDEQEN